MSSEKYIPFGVKASNLASVANFSSTMEDSYILIIANNCNTPVDNGNSYDNVYNNLDNAALFGVNFMNSSVNNNQEAYIGIKNNELSHKIAKFNRETINLDVNTIINGNLCPTINSNYDIGSVNNQWKNLYLSESINALEIYGDGHGISNINISDRTTSELSEGSNLYFTSNRFQNNLYQSTLDQIQNGTSNKFISDGEIVGDINIDGSLSVNTIYIRNIDNLREEGLSISNFVTEIVAENTSLVKEGSNLYYTAQRVGNLIDSSNIHVSNYILHISNDITSDILHVSNEIYQTVISNDSNMSNFVTNSLENNVNVSNLISNTSNFLKNYIDTSSNNLLAISYSHDNNVSNYIENVSDYLVEYIDTKQPNITGSASTIVNSILSSRSVVTTNIGGLITTSSVTVTELEHLKGTSNNVQKQIDNIKDRIAITTADEIREGTSNKYIVDNVYDDDLRIVGTLYASNLSIKGFSTTIDTVNYVTENLEIISKDADGPSLLISHESMLHNIIETCNNDEVVFFITNENNIGVGINAPNERLEVAGMVKAEGFIGNGDLLRQVYISDRSTSFLPEGSNLYFTSERVGDIIDTSNIGISNFVQNTSNLLRIDLESYVENSISTSSDELKQYAINLGVNHSNYVDKKYLNSLTFMSLNITSLESSLNTTINKNDSNMSNYIFTSVNDNDSNMSNYVGGVSDLLFTSVNDNDSNMSNYVGGVSDLLFTSVNDNDSNMSNYVGGVSDLLFTSVNDNDSNMSNYVGGVSDLLFTSVNDNDSNMSNYIGGVSDLLFTSVNDNDSNMSNYIGGVSDLLFTSVNDNDSNMSNYIGGVSDLLFTSVNDNDSNMSNYVGGVSDLLFTSVNDNDSNMSNYVGGVSDLLFTSVNDNDSNMSNYVGGVSDLLFTSVNDNDSNMSNYVGGVSDLLFTSVNDNDSNMSNYVGGVSDLLFTSVNDNDSNMSNYIGGVSDLLFTSVNDNDSNMSNYIGGVSDLLFTSVNDNDSNMSNYIGGVSDLLFTSVNDNDSNMSNYVGGVSDLLFTSVNDNDSNMSNYIGGVSDLLFTSVNDNDSNMSNYIGGVSDLLFTSVNDNDSNMSNYIGGVSDLLFTSVNDNDSNMSNYVGGVSDLLFTSVNDNDSNMSNYMENRTEHFTLVDSNMSNYMTATSNIISDRISKLDTDDITQGVRQKFIVDNVWDNDLTISGTLYTSNIRAVGSNTIIFTDIYTTESLGVVSTAEDSDAFIISHSGDGINNVMTATVADEPAMVITHQKLVGIGRSDPSEALDVLGVTKSTEFVGIGSNLTQILTNYSTTELVEGTNLYYTAERVGIIVSSSNIESSNYVDLMDSNMSNYMENRTEHFTLVDSNMSNYMENRTEYFTLVDSNMSNYMENRTEYFTLVDSNMSNYMENRTEYFTLVDSNMSNYIQNRTEHFTLVDSNMSNYVENRTEHFTLVDSNMSNYMENRTEHFTLVDSNMSNYVENRTEYFTLVDSNMSNYMENRTEHFTLVDSNMSNYMTATSNIISDRISKLDTDDITQGVHQKFIVDNVWDNDLTISGTLYTSNIRAVGSNTIIFTDIYTTESLGVVSTAEDSDAFIISHSGDGINNVMTATVADEPAMVITHQKLVGIGRSDPSEALDVLGVTKSTEFVGIGSNLTQILTNYSTTELIEGTNLYYTAERVGIIVSSSNIESSNYVDLMDSNMSNYVENRTEHFTLVDSNMSNYMENRTEHFTLVDSNMSNYVENRTEYFTLVDSNMSNYMENRTEHFTLVDSNMSNYMTATSNIISDRISKLDTDDITQGVHQKFIVDNVWDNDLTISGTLYTSNIRAVGSNTIIFTDIYTTESLGVVSTAEDSDAFIISHSGDGINNVMTATVADEPAMVITHQKLVGIGRSDPSEALDVLGVTKSTEFVGIGSNLTQILTNYSTTELIEGTNLYYTAERVGIIVSSSNVESSNYVDLMDSNMSNYMENRTEHFTLVDSNMSNYMTTTSNIISQNLSTLDNLVREDIQTKLEQTSNFAILMDDNMSNYVLHTSNNINEKINNLSADQLANGTSNKFIVNDTIYSDLNILGGIDIKFLIIDGIQFDANSYIPELNPIIYNLDLMTDGTSNKYIKNNVYDNDLTINGTLEVDNITVHNKISLINNSVYSSECLDIVNITDSASIKVSQIGSGDIFHIENDYEQIFVMKNNGYFGNTVDPLYNVDINGIINATYIRGDGSQMSNVNIIGNNTSDLEEGSNLYFTEDRVYKVLYSSNYAESNLFKQSIDSLYISIDDIKSALLCVDLDTVVQGSINKYIVNNIYNDSLIINGTLTVRDIQIMDLEDNYSNIYTSNLYKCIDHSNIASPEYLNISNIVNGIIGNLSFTNGDETSNLINDSINPIYSNVNDIYSNLDKVNIRIDQINTDITSRSADYLIQGTSNKFMVNDVYDGSMFVNGVLTVRGINIIDIDDYVPSQDSTLQNFNVEDVYTTNANISNIVRTILSQENFENQINSTYELMAYAIERETSILSNRLNSQANEISLLKNNIETLTNLVNSMSS